MENKEEKDINQIILDDVKGFVKEYFIAESGKPLNLVSYQKEFIEDVLRRDWNKFVWISSTRVGKSESVACLGTLISILNDGEQVVIVAPTTKQAERLFKRIKNYFMSDKRLMAFVDFSRGFKRDEINLRNCSSLKCLSAAGKESLLGAGATTLIIDEVGSIPDSIIKTRVLRMLASSGVFEREPIQVIIGTPHVANYLYEAWNSPNFRKYKVTWKEGVEEGILDEAEVEYQKSIMTETEFRMWYEGEFSLGIESLFSTVEVSQCMVLPKITKQEDLDHERYDYYAGLDVARLGKDESCFFVNKIAKGVHFEDAIIENVYYGIRGQQALSNTLGWVTNLINKYRPRAVGVDMIGLGSGIYDMLREKFGETIRGISMQGQQRTDVYVTLSELIKTGRILLLNDEKLKYQFNSFNANFDSNGRIRISKKTNMQDDVVDALAMSVYILKTDKAEVFDVADFLLEEGGMDWLR